MKAFWYNGNTNFGDMLNIPILNHFLGDVEYSEEPGRLLAIGSIIALVKSSDVVWGSGLISDVQLKLPPINVLALRGPLTARNCRLSTDTYGDPAILLPLIYKPKTDKIHKKGYVPHYADPEQGGIDVLQSWQQVVDQICECEEITSSSLHGIVMAESYGIPATYKPCNKVIGGDFKFKDYLLGTGRNEEDLYKTPIPPIKDLELRQQLLITKLKEWQLNQGKGKKE